MAVNRIDWRMAVENLMFRSLDVVAVTEHVVLF